MLRRGLLLVAAAAACGVAFASNLRASHTAALVPPPVISLNLANVRAATQDSKGIPCNSFGADQAFCAKHKGDPTTQKIFYKFCAVGQDDASTCELPQAAAHDHHEGKIPVTTTIKLYVRSDKHKGPVIANKVVSKIDWDQRGEYRIRYDAKDSSGNAANSVYFHLFMVDHVAPVITTPVIAPEKNKGRFVVLPITAKDNYDGDVTDMVKVKLTHPSGFSETVSSLAPETVRVDTHKHGTWTIDVKARDLASAFGLNYMDNVASTKGVVVVANGQITQIKFGKEVTTYKPKPHIQPLPMKPKPSVPKGPHVKHYTPPIVMLHFGGNLVARGSPFGAHHTEKNYRKHLRQAGVSQEVIDNQVAMIVAREERLAVKLGPKAVWKPGQPLF